MSGQLSRENRRGHQVMNLMVRSAQEVDWYTNIHTGHNVLILKKKRSDYTATFWSHR